ncbi:B12-binding domain-containing radical SAM protein [Candidatus Omnitrophota bacterium]
MEQKIKVLLVGPYKDRDGSGDSFLAPPFGLYRMKFYIENILSNVSVEVVDPNISDFRSYEGPYNIIGFSPLHLTLSNDLYLFQCLKERFPDAIFIVGGIEASFLREEIFEFAPFDMLVLGEGEKPLLQIIERVKSGQSEFHGIRSVYIRSNDSIIFGGYGEQLNLEEMIQIYDAYDPSRIPYDNYWNHNAKLYDEPNRIEINTIRSIFSNMCPYGCKFCSTTNFLSYSYRGELSSKAKYHIIPVEKTIDFIIKTYESWADVETIIFDDDNLSLSLEYLKELSLRIISLKKNGVLKQGVSFICQGRPDVFSRAGADILPYMKKAGFRMIMYGVESFSDRVLLSIGKRLKREDALRSIDNTLSAGIEPLVYIILFTPEIKKDELLETLDICLEQIRNNVQVSTNLLLMDIPGSDFYYDNSMRRYPKEYAIKPDIKFSKSDYIWPFDQEMYLLAKDLIDNYYSYENSFKQKYGIRHIPGRVYSLVIFDAIYAKFGLHEKQRYLDDFLKGAVVSYS